MLITRSPEVASHAVASGVDLIFVDLEIIGKQVRQQGRSTVISGHTLQDVERVRAVIPKGKLLVRLNPWATDSPREVEEVIARGADQVMLPMFRQARELEQLVRVVDGRASVIGLLETAEAAASAKEIAAVSGLDRIHIGLNDLHLALKRRFMFELLIDGTVTRIAAVLCENAVPFGIGGLARIGEGLVPAESLVAKHVATGSTGAILSRTFQRGQMDVGELASGPALAREIDKLRVAIAACRQLSPSDLVAQCADMEDKIRRVAAGP